MSTDDANVATDTIDTVEAHDSVSQAGSGSSSGRSSGSVARRKLELAAQKASHIAEARYVEQRHALEIEELKLRQRKEAFETKVRLSAIEAEQNVLSQIVAEAENHPVDLNPPLGQPPSHSDSVEVVLNPYAREWRNDNTVQELVRQGQEQQQHLLDVIRLPSAQLPVFDGDVLQYHSFIRLFETTVERNTVDSCARLARLLQYCSGRAKQVISCCAMMDPDEGFRKAKELLKNRFGNNFLVSEAWVKKVTQGPPLKPSDRVGLQCLADDLCNCYHTLKAMNFMTEISNQSTLVKIMTRLPPYLQNRWRREAGVIRRRTGNNPTIEDAMTFVREAAEESNDPIYGALASQPADHSRNSTHPFATIKRPHATSAVTSATEVYNPGHQRTNQSVRDQQQARCVVCGEAHKLFACQQFKSGSVEDRIAIARTNKLCFNCLEPGHHARQCHLTRTCSVAGCGKRHTKFLHPVQPELPSLQGEPTSESLVEHGHVNHLSTSVSVGIGAGIVALPVVPVIIINPITCHSESTYALLDSGSTHTFIDRSLSRDLGLQEQSQSLTLSTLNGISELSTTTVSLEIADTERQTTIEMPMVLTKERLPIDIKCLANADDIGHWTHLTEIPLPRLSDSSEIRLLIGQDCPEALLPLEIRRGSFGAPYATRTVLGWTVNGPINRYCNRLKAASNFIQSDVDLEHQVERFWKLDALVGPANDEVGLSVNDKRALSVWQETIRHHEGHYELAIPCKQRPVDLPVNIDIAKQRLSCLRMRFMGQPELHAVYRDGMESLLRDYAEEVPADEIDSRPAWYLPHHPVRNPNKPEKTRIVFDCSAKFCGKSLNDVVLQGPDLTNKLVSVLLRFRQEPVAVMADVESMFHQVRVTPCDRDLLRFLWLKGGDINDDVGIYRMKVHLFGGIWSPSCCSFALRRTAEDNKSDFDAETVSTVLNNFYVDDCLKSVETVEKAVVIVQQLCELLSRGGFRLTKWVSNSREVMSAIPKGEWSKNLKSSDLHYQALPVERALGVQWDVESDAFTFQTVLKNKPVTRRGMLSIVSSVFDPLGLANPFVMPAKWLIQDLCRRGVDWDVQLSPEDEQIWASWLNDLDKLKALKLDRCLKSNLSRVTESQLHHFSDASERGYGAVSYLRMIGEDGSIHCAFVMSKSRVAPTRSVTIPRLELCAAVLSVKLDVLIRRELDIDISRSVFWTDSTVVLHYIYSDNKRFQTFVANRVAVIHSSSVPSQWRHIGTNLNPADDVSRGLRAEALMGNTRWFNGPPFLWESEDKWPENHLAISSVPEESLEVKQGPVVYITEVDDCDVFDRIFQRRSSWFKLKRDVAYILRMKQLLRDKASNLQPQDMPRRITVSELDNAELQIIRYVQIFMFPNEVKLLNARQKVPKSSALYRLEPVMGIDKAVRVGGRLPHHPVILPHRHAVSDLVIRHFHVSSAHSGREHTLSEVRRHFWIVRARPAVRRVLRECTLCRHRDAKPVEQRMADLPDDRISAGGAPFSCVGIDLFGPFAVKRGRSAVKRYGCIFTCLKIRAVHIEVVHSLDTDSFINALQRFICRRGSVKEIRSDNGSNFTAAEKELRTALNQWNHTRIDDTLRQKGIQWRFNPPAASHMGGVWERQIRSVRRILSALMKDQLVDDEALSTMFCLVESVINSRPLTTVSDDHNDMEPLTPNHLLTFEQALPPPGNFTKLDTYSRRRWRQIQYLADVFWRRWTREYLPTLQLRQKWRNPVKNIEVGDVVLIVDDNAPRHVWHLGRVTETCPAPDGLVRSAKVVTRTATLTRPVHKLCLLESVIT